MIPANTKIEELIEKYQFSVRTEIVLKSANVRTLADLARKTEDDLLSDPRCGSKTIAQIKWLLRKAGLKLKTGKAS